MPSIFSSPLLHAKYRSTENTEYALSYYIEKVIPRGGVVYVLFPKTILAKLLPPIAEKKNCKVIPLYGSHEAALKLIKTGTYSRKAAEPDIILAEPDGFTYGGALFKPEETKLVKGLPLVCVGSSKQWSSIRPATHDLVPVQKIVSENGIHTPEQIEEFIVSSYSKP